MTTSEEITEVKASVREFLDFLSANASCEPERAIEWPMTLLCRDKETTLALQGHLNKLEKLCPK